MKKKKKILGRLIGFFESRIVWTVSLRSESGAEATRVRSGRQAGPDPSHNNNSAAARTKIEASIAAATRTGHWIPLLPGPMPQ